MSAEIQMSSFDGETVDFPYKAVSRGAIISVVVAVLALPGLVSDFSALLGLCVIGMIASFLGLKGIKRFPNEFSGAGIAKFGFIANALMFFGGISFHTYTYYTEVPEGYTRVQFYDLQQAPDAPQRPTDAAVAAHGEDIFLKGYIHPSSGSGLLKHFILVPDLGTCCFGGQPPSSDMVEVTLGGGQTTKANLRKKKLAGKFRVNQLSQEIKDFENAVFYQLRADQVK